MRIPTSLVAMEPERRRQRPETQGGNARLKGKALFRGVGTRGHGILLPCELSERRNLLPQEMRLTGTSLSPTAKQSFHGPTSFLLLLTTALMRYLHLRNLCFTKFALLKCKIHWFLEDSQSCITITTNFRTFHQPRKEQQIP